MTALLDVNVLVSLAWPNHVHHAASRHWFLDAHSRGWATCPLTESGFLRVSANRRVIPDARSPREAAAVLRLMRDLAGHRFWEDDVSLATSREINIDTVDGYRQITDAHLLALAARHEGTLVTFDRGVASLARANDCRVEQLGL